MDAEIERNADDHVSEVSVENRADEDADDHNDVDNPEHTMRSVIVSKPNYFAKHISGIAHIQFSKATSH